MGYKQLYINGIGTGTYGIYISSDTYLNAPSPDITAHQVAGRSGDLIQWNKRLNNIVRKFDCYIPDSAQANFDEFKRMLYTNIGYVEISSDYEADTYQRGYLAEEIEATPFQSEDVLRVTFSLYFSCEPQKYFKTNTEQTIDTTPGNASTYVIILPRTHKLVQTVLKALPSEAVPNGDYFVYCQGTTRLNQDPKILDRFSFSMVEQKFVVAFWCDWNSDVKYLKFGKILGFSNFGDLTNAPLDMTSPTGYAEIGFLFPAEFEGRWSLFIQDTDGNQDWNSGELHPRGTISQPKAIGIHYVITISGTFGNYQAEGGMYDKENYIVLKGSLGAPTRKQTIDAMIQIDATPFRQMLPDLTNAYNYSITIDTETMDITATFNGNTFRMTDYVNVTGELDGVADELRIYEYHKTLTSRYHLPLWIEAITIEPKWWAI